MSESSAESPRTSVDPESPEPGTHSPDAADASASDETTSGSTKPGAELPTTLTFRITPVALLGVFALAVCVTPVAWALPSLLALYLLPLGLLIWVVRLRTVVTADRIRARSIVRTTHVEWSEIASLRLDERRWLRAVLTSGKEVWLPAIRVRDLPRVAAMSGGRLRDPFQQPAESSRQEAESPEETESAEQ